MVAVGLQRGELVGDRANHAQGERRIRHVPLLMPELLVLPAGLVAAELRSNRTIDQLGEIVRDLDVGRQAEEDVPPLPRPVLLAPDAAVAEFGDRADAFLERDALPVARLVDPP